MSKIIRFALGVLLISGSAVNAEAPMCTRASLWKDWQEFKANYLSSVGRIIDPSDERLITSSEGQSYALFFALVDNDPQLFAQLLHWTEVHLAQGDLSAHLPAWLWGRNAQGDYEVLDANTASDADLWLAYALLEAGRLWKNHHYRVLGLRLLQHIEREEIASVPQLGYLLLPGRWGFEEPQQWRFNPSYAPPQLLSRVAQAVSSTSWRQLAQNVPKLLVESAPSGIAPDWITWGRVTPDAPFAWHIAQPIDEIGSYDAIRVYLWVGMLHPQAEHSSMLQTHFKAVGVMIDAQGNVPERINIKNQRGVGRGNPGFLAALLPLFRQEDISKQWRIALANNVEPLGYYASVLSLFGKGWDEGRFRFAADGALLPGWAGCRQ